MDCGQEVHINTRLLRERGVLVILGIAGYTSNLLGREKQPLAPQWDSRSSHTTAHGLGAADRH